MSLVPLTEIEDVIEELARNVLGSDKLQEAIGVIRGFRETVGHPEPEPVTVDTTPAAAKDEAIAQLSTAVQDLLGEVARLKGEAPAAAPAPAAPAEPVTAPDTYTPPAPTEPVVTFAPEPTASAANPFSPPAPVDPAAPTS